MGRYLTTGSTNGVVSYEHIEVAERALGRKLRWPELVHHADGDAHNNDPSNLVICPDQAYHKLLHIRLDAFKATGNPDERKCVRCGEYDSIEAMAIHSRSGSMSYVHPACRRAFDKSRYTPLGRRS